MPTSFAHGSIFCDALINRTHHNALNTVTRFMSSGPDDYAEFARGRVVNDWTIPF